jgi:S1-C subfamily serine protease
VAKYRIKNRRYKFMSQQAGDYLRSLGEEWSDITPVHESDLDLDMILAINVEDELQQKAMIADRRHIQENPFEADIAPEFYTPPYESDEYYGSRQGGSSCLFPIIAVIVAICVLFWGLSSVFDFIQLPDISFLQRSAELKKDPALQSLKEAVVTINVPQTNAAGTGFNISPEGMIITNRHVVEDATFINIRFPDGSRFIARDWQVMVDYDLAVVRLDDSQNSELPYVELAVRQPELGADIIFIGNPLGFDWTVSEGIYHGIMPLEDGTEVIVFDGPVHAGSSGSPIFDSEGLVIGVIYARFMDIQNRGLAVPISVLLKLNKN